MAGKCEVNKRRGVAENCTGGQVVAMSPWIALRRTLLEVSGLDARAFLQNILTQNLDRLDDGVAYSALLSPQGKVITTCSRAWRDGESCSTYLRPAPPLSLLV